MYIIPDIITETARELRKNMTQAEKMIWGNIRGKKLKYKFLRQRPIYLYTDNN
jgi:very-short-patch-repair endonuclease